MIPILLTTECYVWTSSMQRCSVVRTDTDLVPSLYIVSSLCSGEDRLSLHWYWPGLVYTFTGMGQHLAFAGGETHSYPIVLCLHSRGRGMNELLWSTGQQFVCWAFGKKNIHDSEHQVRRYCRSWMIIQVCEKLFFIGNWPKYVYWELFRWITSLLYWMLAAVVSETFYVD